MGYKIITMNNLPRCCEKCMNSTLCSLDKEEVVCKWNVMFPTRKHTCKRQQNISEF